MKQRCTTLEYALLGLLNLQPHSGFSLTQLFQQTPIGYYSSSPGAIYPALRRLEERGLITATVDGGGPQRVRKTYHLAEKGRELLRGWLVQEPDRDEVRRRIDIVMLRFALAGGLVSVTESLTFLRALAAEAKEFLAEIEHIRKTTAMPLHGRLALDAAILEYQARGRWARLAMAELQATEPDAGDNQ